MKRWGWLAFALAALFFAFHAPVGAQLAQGNGNTTACPTASGGITITGNSMPNCSIAAGGAGTLPLPSPGRLCAIPGTAFAVCGAGTDGLEAAAETIAGIAHFWPLSAGAPAAVPTTCPTTLPDDINNGSFATAAASPVAVTPTGSPNPAPRCYAPPILGGPMATYASSVIFPANAGTYGYISIPESALPTSGNFSFGCVLYPTSTTQATFRALSIARDTLATMTLSGNAGNLNFQTSLSGGTDTGGFSIDKPMLWIYTWDGTNSKTYINGQITSWSTNAPGYSDAGGGSLGSTSGGNQFYGYMQDCFEANVGLTYTQVWTLAVGATL